MATLAVFIVFAVTFLKEKMAWNYVASFLSLLIAVVFAFAFNPAKASAGQASPTERAKHMDQ